ncbi:MAG: hypothetical protein GF398_07190 [Chitinivibrionales bacterium]|nr:hypothetical protein [Chitinivibrionales bacterium]
MSFPASKSKMKRVRKTRGSANLKPFRPQLTSLVDVMTIMLVYLLKSFSAEGEIVTVSKDLMLPESSARKKPKVTVNIVVNKSFIMAEDERLAEVDQVLSTDDMLIPALNEWLRQRREKTERIAQYSTDTKFTGDVTIQGDKRIRFRLLKKIMFTCGQQGFNNFSLAVRKKEDS